MTRRTQRDFSPPATGILARDYVDFDRAADHARALRTRYLRRAARLLMRNARRAAARGGVAAGRWLRAGIANPDATSGATLVRR